MKTENKVISLSIFLGLFIGILDSVIDYFMFYEKPFWDLLIFDVPMFEIYIRAMILAIFLVFGIIVSRMMAKRIQAEEKISQQNESAISFFTISKKECLWRSLQENIPDPESISHI